MGTAVLLAFLLYVKPSRRFLDVTGPASAILAEAESWTLFALDPGIEDPPPKDASIFHGHRVLGKTTLDDPSKRADLTYALNWAIFRGGMSVFCFNPRHGIRAETSAGAVDLVICFECEEVHVYLPAAGQPQEVDIAPSASVTFNRIFRDAGLAIAR